MPPHPRGDDHSQLLADLHKFVADEQEAARERLRRIWKKPLAEKLATGLTQRFARLEPRDDESLWAHVDGSESRFREGDLVRLHLGDPLANAITPPCAFEAEEDDRWLLRVERAGAAVELAGGGACYADPEALDLTPYYQQTLEDIAASQVGQDVILPLLSGRLRLEFDADEEARGQRAARAAGLDPTQVQAVGLALGCEQLACIQGPPGTGKTRVLSLIVRLMIERGDRVLVTSHTHTAIHNALNRIHGDGFPTVKIGRETQLKGLSPQVPSAPSLAAWDERPETGGYAIGATPFATCTRRLSGAGFDTVVFDEASQITVPLALMAMRTAKRFVFIGDDAQLPPVLLSRSVLSGEPTSVFSKLTARDGDHTIMLNRTYRMNQWLTAWPSRAFYAGALSAVGPNHDRRLAVPHTDGPLGAVLDPDASAVFIPTRDVSARTQNAREARLVVDICAAVAAAGLPLTDIGVVTPFRTQGRLVRELLASRFGRAAARAVVADTVERMQGQERELIILSLSAGDPVFLAAIAGFFFQPQRLNVSVTRAMTKLIVLGPDQPVLPDLRDFGDPRLQQAVERYIDLIAHCRRVEL